MNRPISVTIFAFLLVLITTGCEMGPEEVKLVSILATALATMVSAGFTYLLKTLGDKAREDMKSERLSNVLYLVDSAAENVVRDLTQTVVEDIKAAAKDGKLPKEERDAIKNQAVDKLKDSLGSEGIKLITRAVGGNSDTEKLLGTALEAALHRIKNRGN